jgi:hypothetical protein
MGIAAVGGDDFLPSPIIHATRTPKNVVVVFSKSEKHLLVHHEAFDSKDHVHHRCCAVCTERRFVPHRGGSGNQRWSQLAILGTSYILLLVVHGERRRCCCCCVYSVPTRSRPQRLFCLADEEVVPHAPRLTLCFRLSDLHFALCLSFFIFPASSQPPSSQR